MKHLHAPQQFATFTSTPRLRAVLFTHFPEEYRETAFGYPTPPRTILSACALATLLAAPAAWANSGGTDFTDHFGDPAYGGFGSGKTVIFDQTSPSMLAYGGYSDTGASSPIDTTGKANGNTLTVTGTVDWASGGTAIATGGNAEATGNHLYVKGTVKGAAVGGGVFNGSGCTATGNFVFIDGGTARAVHGGHSQWCGSSGDVTGNTVTLISGNVTEEVVGGFCSPSSCSNLSNILAVQGKDFPVGTDVESFDTLNFTLPADIKNGEVMLDVGGKADFPVAPTKVSIAVAGMPALKQNNTITLIKAGTGVTITPQLTGSAATYFTATTADPFVVELTAPLVPVKVAGSTAEGGEVTCEHPEVAKDIGTTTCTATAKAGYTFDAGSMTASNGTLTERDGTACKNSECKLSGVTGDVTVSATFTKAPDPTPGGGGGAGGGGGDSSSPTMGELGLLLSGLALAGAAAPALRRREKQGKKADTRQ